MWEAEFKSEIVINVLAENSLAKEIQILMPKDCIMKEHKAPFPITLQVLRGRIYFSVGNERCELSALEMVSLEANVPHSLSGIEDSILRLSLAKQDNKTRINAVLKK